MLQKYLGMLIAVMLTTFVLASCRSGETESRAQFAENDTSQQESVEEPAELHDVEIQIQVGPIQVMCNGEFTGKCFLVREYELDPWRRRDSIQGFEYEEGFLYDLLIEEKWIDESSIFFPGAGRYTWLLKEVLEKTPVNYSTLLVGPEQAECGEEGLQLCYLVKTEPGGDWQYFNPYAAIEGFDYEPGYLHELVVAEIPLRHVPDGFSPIQYLLVEAVSKTPMEITEQE